MNDDGNTQFTTGLLVAWNLWLFAILNTSEVGLQLTQYVPHRDGGRPDRAGGEPRAVRAEALRAHRGDQRRRLRDLPQVARWKGTGSSDDAANFACVAEAPAGGMRKTSTGGPP